MANLNSKSYHSLIGLLTPEYLGFLKLQVVPRWYGYVYITHTRKPEPRYLSNAYLTRSTQELRNIFIWNVICQPSWTLQRNKRFGLELCRMTIFKLTVFTARLIIIPSINKELVSCVLVNEWADQSPQNSKYSRSSDNQ